MNCSVARLCRYFTRFSMALSNTKDSSAYAVLRKKYDTGPFTVDSLVSRTDPLAQFDAWYKDASAISMEVDVNSINFAFATKDGRPSVRRFFMTNYGKEGFSFECPEKSNLGGDIGSFGAACLYWPNLHRQIRIEGVIKKFGPDGSLLLVPDNFEFWQGHSNRIHDRLRFERIDEQWKVDRLSP